jgi:DNA-binding NtrC family response regulator
MNPAAAMRGMMEGRFDRRLEVGPGQLLPGRPTVMIASVDSDMRHALAQILPRVDVNTIWVKSVDEARNALSAMPIAACFCEIWLQGGTCRELIWHVRRKSADLPVIIVSSSDSSNEYCDWLAAMKLRALYFLTHPYKASDVERLMQFTVLSHTRPLHRETILHL